MRDLEQVDWRLRGLEQGEWSEGPGTGGLE